MLKSNLFEQFTKNQKSALCHSIKSYVKKNFEKSDIMDSFIEDEKYYLEINVSRISFIKDYLYDERFIKDMTLYFKDCIGYYNYQKKQEPYKQIQKEYAKKQRKRAQEFKMSKELPTKKQISYYKALCKKYNIEISDMENVSKLDLRNMISGVLDEHKTD